MIYSLKGKIVYKEEGRIAVEVGGIGFWVFVPRLFSRKLSLNQKISLFCFFSPETFELYGFATQEELFFFQLLNTVPQVGPKIALKLISNLGFSSLAEAILKEKAEFLSKKGGVGTKTAFKIILELKEKLKKAKFKVGKESRLEWEEEELLKEALKNLGFSEKELVKVVDQVILKPATLEEKIKLALRLLAQKLKSKS
ncbi:MAG: hypothetical protein KatS3mg098_151 [Candidatus Parcubacteria bacterium]|nr:Holliday junction branch migration protein RuvA [Patescibacteria group bacterium]BCX15922.1 MAG: hypothetical protein KatS3mg098_151 [Candidatus Parcubacteria bacterium]